MLKNIFAGFVFVAICFATGCSSATSASATREDIPVTSNTVIGLAVVPSNPTLVVMTQGTGLVSLWDIQSRQQLWTYQTPKLELVTALTVSRDGRFLAVGNKSGFLALLDLRRGTLIREFVAPANEGGHYTSLAFSTTNALLFSSEEGTRVRIWDVTSGTLVNRLGTMVGGQGTVAPSLDGKLFYTSGLMAVEVHHVVTGATLAHFQDPNLAVEITDHANEFIMALILSSSFAPDMRYIALGMMNRAVVLDSQTGEQISRMYAPENDKGQVFSKVQFTESGAEVLGFAATGKVFRWNVATGVLENSTMVPGWNGNSTEINFNGGMLPIDFAPDGSFLVYHAVGANEKLSVLKLK